MLLNLNNKRFNHSHIEPEFRIPLQTVFAPNGRHNECFIVNEAIETKCRCDNLQSVALQWRHNERDGVSNKEYKDRETLGIRLFLKREYLDLLNITRDQFRPFYI